MSTGRTESGVVQKKSGNGVRAEQHTLSDKDFRFLCKTVYEVTGIVLDERKRQMVYRRIMRRCRLLKLESFSAYCQLLKTDSEGELPNFINAITTNLTSFFREKHHFDYLRDHFIPQHLQEYGQSKRLRIWSAACSTGEEPYSLAVTLMEAMGRRVKEWDARILATDLDTEVLASARAGVYKYERISDLSLDVKKSWFSRGKGEYREQVKVDPRLQQLITFKQLNLLDAWPLHGPFDVIMCRNVLIYFDKETQHQLVSGFCELLRPGGLLFLGHSESLARSDEDLSIVGRTIFRKADVGEQRCSLGSER